MALSGCVNGRIWGDNFLRGWLSANRWNNKVEQTTIDISPVTGITGTQLPVIFVASSIPLAVVLAFLILRHILTVRTALSVLVLCIEQCSTSDEMKRLSKLISYADPSYKNIIKKELKKIRANKK
jgi:hypothetical protein